MEDIKSTTIENKPIEKTYSFYNLLVFDKELNIVNLINFSNRNLKDNIYDDNSFYVEISLELFMQIRSLLNSNKLKLTKNPLQEQITIQDIQATPLPPQPPTRDELINKALLEQALEVNTLSEKTQGLAQGVLEGAISQNKIQSQLKLMSKAILELTMKGMK